MIESNIKKLTYPLRIETQGTSADDVVAANGTRVTVGGIEISHVCRVDLVAVSGEKWIARLEVLINPARDVVFADQPDAKEASHNDD